MPALFLVEEVHIVIAASPQSFHPRHTRYTSQHPSINKMKPSAEDLSNAEGIACHHAGTHGNAIRLLSTVEWPTNPLSVRPHRLSRPRQQCMRRRDRANANTP